MIKETAALVLTVVLVAGALNVVVGIVGMALLAILERSGVSWTMKR